MGIDTAIVLNPVLAARALATAESTPPETPITRLAGWYLIELQYCFIQSRIYFTLSFVFIKVCTAVFQNIILLLYKLL
jgi:hypothetical protein